MRWNCPHCGFALIRGSDRLAKPVVRPASARRATPAASSLATPMATFEPIAQAKPRRPVAALKPNTSTPYGLPEALPEFPARTWKERLFPVAIAATGLMAIASGIYLYLQGRQVWRAESQATDTVAGPQAPVRQAEGERDNGTILARSPAEKAKPIVIDRINQLAMAQEPGEPSEDGRFLVIRTRSAKTSLREGQSSAP